MNNSIDIVISHIRNGNACDIVDISDTYFARLTDGQYFSRLVRIDI